MTTEEQHAHTYPYWMHIPWALGDVESEKNTPKALARFLAITNGI
jgi:hypothetical protein